MAPSYRKCPACGKSVLAIATRCPRCAHELVQESVGRRPSLRTARLTPLLLTLAILLAVIGLVTLVLGRAAQPDRHARPAPEARFETPLRHDSVSAAASPASPDSAPSAGAVPRAVRTWTKVRAARSPSADVVAVLLPGDSVLVDSLVKGWWRVALEGRVLGYLHRRTLIGD